MACVSFQLRGILLPLQAPMVPYAILPHSYLSGWATLLYLAVVRRLRLRAHMLLVMPELCMQATAVAAAFCCRSNAELALSGLASIQVRLAAQCRS